MLSVFKAINFQRIGTGRNYKELRTVFRVAVFLLLLSMVFYKLRDASFAGIEKIADSSWLFLPLILLATLLNQYFEFRKWKSLAHALEVDSKELVKSYFDGLTAGFITPNGWGTFLGRMLHVEKQKRADLVMGTALSNASQFLPTVIFGGIALLAVNKFPPLSGWLTLGLSVILVTAYVLSHQVLIWFKRLKIVEKIGSFDAELFTIKWDLLFWSTFRYTTFVLQYALFFNLFGYFNYADFIPNVAVLFILTSVVPSLWSGKVLIREAAAIFLFSGTSFQIGDVVLICLLVWLSNVILPVVFGTMRNLIFGRKIAVHALD